MRMTHTGKLIGRWGGKSHSVPLRETRTMWIECGGPYPYHATKYSKKDGERLPRADWHSWKLDLTSIEKTGL